MKKLAIITTHPIQYNAPFFRLLSQSKIIQIKVFYTWAQTKEGQVYDPSFNKVIQWDIPLLEGYDFEFVENQSNDPGSHHFWGIKNKDIIDVVNGFEPEALLIYGWNFWSHLKLIRTFSNKKIIFFRGDSTLLAEPNGISIRKILRRIFLKWLYNHVDFAFYVGKSNKDYFLKHGLKQNQLIYAPHAIDNQRFEANEQSSEEQALKWREQLGIAKESIVFLFAGKLESIKNIQFLLQCFVNVNLPLTDLVIVGNGILEIALKEFSKQYRNIHFMDFQNQMQMPIVYRISDVFVLTSKSETWGLSLNESMACKRPIIASDTCGAAKDLIIEGETGWIFRNGSSYELEKKLTRAVVIGKFKLQQMGLKANEHIKKFTNSDFVLGLENRI